MGKGKRIGLYFGSFNPVTLSHMYVAQTCLEETDIDKVRFIISPQNPEKDEKDLIRFKDRHEMLLKSMVDLNMYGTEFAVDTVENHLPKPSYTYRTINEIKRVEKEKVDEYFIIMGEDTYSNIKNWEKIEELYGEKLMVVPREHSYGEKRSTIRKIELKEREDEILEEFETPLLNIFNIFSTLVRNRIKEGKNIHGMVAPKVANYIHDNDFYKE